MKTEEKTIDNFTRVNVVPQVKKTITQYIENLRCGDLTDDVYELLESNTNVVYDPYEIALAYSDLCMHLLALLSNPDISNQLPYYWLNGKAGKYLGHLHNFFQEVTRKGNIAHTHLKRLDYSLTLSELEYYQTKYAEEIKKQEAIAAIKNSVNTNS